LSRKTVQNWVEKFSQGRSKLADDTRPGMEVSETTVKRLLFCGFRRTGKAMGQIISQKIELFITPAVRTSNPTKYIHSTVRNGTECFRNWICLHPQMKRENGTYSVGSANKGYNYWTVNCTFKKCPTGMLNVGTTLKPI
jgi:hypothetical protein